ncbi:MAG: threonine-phosphate decarboxylase [Rhodobacter sp.]|nr:threonine-phosphate decarboxylase [Rhodobacter sp.]
MVTRDHGGNLEAARAAFGGADWIDLSTGINRRPYPVPALPPEAWTALPTRDALEALIAAAAAAYGIAPEAVLPLAGAQAAIQLVPRLRAPGTARVLTPTYNEHAGALSDAGWRVEPVATLDALAGADLAVVVNPNNPDGQTHDPAALVALSARVGLLVVDESFADPHPALSVAGRVSDRLLVLRSFGKFYGLAGVRLGFALGGPGVIGAMRAMAGPWSVSGPALAIGAAALHDTGWQEATTARLTQDAARLDALAARAGWRLVGGTALFRTYDTPDAAEAQTHLARHAIWSRRFPYSARWLRLGLPDGAEWARVETAVQEVPCPSRKSP